ncbi:ABC transporter ATP-binding protein [Paraclostridium bifermentans]|uniref:ABC transporter ATP-binding protein n=1 Tax=Paraclostridium bifermentans TaxID=1490 RepID=UPI00359C70EC
MKSKLESRFGPKKKPKNLKKTVLRLIRYFKEEKKILILLSIMILINSLIIVFIPILIGKSIDIIDSSSSNLSQLNIIIIILLSLYIIDGLVNICKEFVVINISQRVIKNIRIDIFKKLQLLPMYYFDTHHKGDLMSRMTNDIDSISSGVSSSMIQIISAIITIVGTITMMSILSLELTIVSIITMPLVILLSKYIANRSKGYFKKQQINLGILNTHIEESINNINIIKSFNYEDECIEKFYKINDKLLDSSLKAQIYSSLLMPMMNVISNIAFILISILGSYLAIENIITVGTITTFLSYTKQFTRPLNELANLFNTFQLSIAGCERVFEVIDENIKENTSIKSIKPIDINGNIEFENVYFKYDENDKYVLNGINFKIKEGTSNAIVGTTGSGKTTIINLINSLYDTYSGKILIDGEDIKKYDKKNLNEYISVVSQDIYLFNGSIMDNIRYSKLDASDKEVIECCKLVNIHGSIIKLKNKYDTYIYECGNSLSEGQKQLISIARAILKNPSILILDEATSSIDTHTEKRVQEAIKVVMKGRTSIIIAHRLSTIRYCDNIMVIDKGKVVEYGTHEDLIKNKGIYYKSIKSLNIGDNN